MPLNIQFTNNASTTLAANVDIGVTTFSVSPGTGAEFPVLTGELYFYATLFDTSGNVEIVKVTARSADAFTVARGQEGTTQRNWLAGDYVELRLTKGGINDIITYIEELKNSVVSLQAEVDNIQLGGVPVGTIIYHMGDTPPVNYWVADGRTANRVTNAALFAAIGTRYGAGDGLTTFKIPDLRGKFLRGWDDGAGNDPEAGSRTGGDEVGSTQADEIRSHIHQVFVWGDINATFASGTNNGVHCQTPGVPRKFPLYPEAFGGAETRPANTAAMICIKYQ